jgi:hypothetical protein
VLRELGEEADFAAVLPRLEANATDPPAERSTGGSRPSSDQ